MGTRRQRSAADASRRLMGGSLATAHARANLQAFLALGARACIDGSPARDRRLILPTPRTHDCAAAKTRGAPPPVTQHPALTWPVHSAVSASLADSLRSALRSGHRRRRLRQQQQQHVVGKLRRLLASCSAVDRHGRPEEEACAVLMPGRGRIPADSRCDSAPAATRRRLGLAGRPRCVPDQRHRGRSVPFVRRSDAAIAALHRPALVGVAHRLPAARLLLSVRTTHQCTC